MIKITNEDNMVLMARYPDNYFDLAIVDPPYCLDDWNDRGTNKKLKTPSELDKIKKWEEPFDFEVYFKELFRVSKSQIVWGGNHFLDYLGKTKMFIVWDKTLRGMHFNDCELAWCNNLKNACRIYTKSPKQSNRIHPTQKPVKLYEWLLDNYAKDGDKILDTHLGSGSIAIACHNRKFNLTACELDKDYFDAAMKRLKQHQQQLTIFDV